MADNAITRMNSGIADLMRQYPSRDTPAYGDVPPGYMLSRNADGKVVVVPANKYTPSTGARPDQSLTVGPNGEVVSSQYASPALSKALDISQGSSPSGYSLSATGDVMPTSPSFTDNDFSRLLAMQHPLGRATTQADINEEARLREGLALSAKQAQSQPQSDWFNSVQPLSSDRITQMYGAPSTDSQDKVDQVERNAITDEGRTRADAGQPATATPVDRALTVAGQASPQFSQIPGGPLAMFAQPHSGAQYQPMSASSRSWTDPNMPQPSNPMPWGDNAPAGHLDTTSTGSIPAAPVSHLSSAPLPPPRPSDASAQSSPGFFSGLFKDPYAGMSPKQMNEAAQRMQGTGDEYGANLLTQRADNAVTSSDGSFAQGGSVDENHPVVQRAMHLVRSFLLNG